MIASMTDAYALTGARPCGFLVVGNAQHSFQVVHSLWITRPILWISGYLLWESRGNSRPYAIGQAFCARCKRRTPELF
jgi:hypothetical protein